MLLMILRVKKMQKRFMKRKQQEKNWKGYDSLFNSWADKKDIIE